MASSIVWWWAVLLHLLPLVTYVVTECKISTCTDDYEDTISGKHVPKESSREFCQVLLDFSSCLKHLSKSCRGDINYLSHNAASRSLFKYYNCSSLVSTEQLVPEPPRPRPTYIPALPPSEQPPPPPPSRHCEFLGKDKYQYCGLFGDPHLKTFRNEYQTCRVSGAWPLIDNPYLAVQVTNDPIFEGSPATVTTKVTVLIKGRCTTEKRYEATADQPLPAAFVDGTRPSAPSDLVRLTIHEMDDESQSVEIFLKYIKTTLVVRQVGKYLAFAVQMPEEVLNSIPSDTQLSLCNYGCPASEQLSLSQAHGNALSWDQALKLCRDVSALSNEINNNLTDHYLDWCVFDVMTAGAAEADLFTVAAHSAQAVALRFEPESLKNRTEPRMFSAASSQYIVSTFSMIFSWLVLSAAVRLM